MNQIPILAVIGCALSAYALKVANSAKSKSYHPVCDVSTRISCTKALTSKYSKILGFHNAIIGLVYYVSVYLLMLFELKVVLQVIAGIAVGVSVILAGLQFRQRNFCLVCTSVYVVNILILISVW